jgi:DNA-directed RNA polymerase subunit RPC12/RpoP
MKKLEDLQCPLCEATLKVVMPSKELHVKCEYCGGTILLPLRKAPECLNHPQTSAVGLCSDCNKPFCSECLKKVEIRQKGENKNLFLCPRCFKKRRKPVFGVLGIGFFDAGIIILVFAYMLSRISMDLTYKFLYVSLPLILIGLFFIFWAWKSPRSLSQLLASLHNSLRKTIRSLKRKNEK